MVEARSKSQKRQEWRSCCSLVFSMDISVFAVDELGFIEEEAMEDEARADALDSAKPSGVTPSCLIKSDMNSEDWESEISEMLVVLLARLEIGRGFLFGAAIILMKSATGVNIKIYSISSAKT